MSQAPKIRLDVLITERGLAESRNKAQALILAGQVRVLSPLGKEMPQASLKPGTPVSASCTVKILESLKYVSRGGEKLEAALIRWNVSPRGKICLDVGASTGGFTDCLLQGGALKVYAVDVGTGQMHPRIRNDARVEVFEQTHILKWTPPWQGPPLPPPSLAVIDVSFISLKSVLAKTAAILPAPAEMLCLIKPQFEVGPRFLKKGIVKDASVRDAAVEKILAAAGEGGLAVQGHFPCPVAGAQGNREEWLYLAKTSAA